jgi:hypothetical protein
MGSGEGNSGDEILRTSRSIQEFRIDFLLEEEFACDVTFVQRLLAFCGINAVAKGVLQVVHSLADRHGEADLVVVLSAEVESGKVIRLALLIEDKIAAGAQPKQAERYRRRGEDGLGKHWEDYRTILVAPNAYVGERNGFQAFVPLETIAEWLCSNDSGRAKFRKMKIAEAIEKKNLSGVKIIDQAMTEFREAYHAYLKVFNEQNDTDFDIREPRPTYDGDTWFYLKSASLPERCRIRHRSRTSMKAAAGLVEIAFLNTKLEKLGALKTLLTPNMTIISNGNQKQHAAIEIKVPEIKEGFGFDKEQPKVELALLAGKQLWRLVLDHKAQIEKLVLNSENRV